MPTGSRSRSTIRRALPIPPAVNTISEPNESDVDFYVRQKAFLAQLDAEYRACVLAQGVDHYETWYHSVDQVRRFQFTEAALVLILSGLFLLPALWGLRRLKP